MCVCTLYHWCHGDKPSINAFNFEVSSLSTMFGHTLTDDADPAAVLADLLTAPVGKLAFQASKVEIDTASFQSASDTVFAEGHGYFRIGNFIASPNHRPNLKYVWRGFDPPDKGWRYELATMERLFAEGRIHAPEGKRPRVKRYLDEMPGAVRPLLDR
jgi:hypothetical protein